MNSLRFIRSRRLARAIGGRKSSARSKPPTWWRPAAAVQFNLDEIQRNRIMVQELGSGRRGQGRRSIRPKAATYDALATALMDDAMNWRRGLLRLWLVNAGFLWGKDAAWANWKVPGGPIKPTFGSSGALTQFFRVGPSTWRRTCLRRTTAFQDRESAVVSKLSARTVPRFRLVLPSRGHPRSVVSLEEAQQLAVAAVSP